MRRFVQCYFVRNDGQEMFCHSVQNIHKLAQTSINKSAIVYVLKEKGKVISVYKISCVLMNTKSFRLKREEVFNVMAIFLFWNLLRR